MSDASNDASEFQTLLARMGVFVTQAWLSPDAANNGNDLSAIAKRQRGFVTRFDIDNGKTIDWWATGNTPDTFLPEIKAGVEGWNRYYNDFRKDKPVMRFRGKLPANAKVGDPRYNVVFFDAVADAPAAYESQAADPLTGIQSHSMIYLPFAWYNISNTRYLQDADDTLRAGSSGLTGKAAALWQRQKARGVIKCALPSEYKNVPFLVNSRAAETEDEAGRALVRSTLLHEVGHALGMAHNFKGTMTGDASKYNETDWFYSSSTMDYNPFAMEDTLFSELNNPERDVTKGLVQPYDRQFIDIVYNRGQGTLERGEKANPYCNDADHEDTTNGVDPFCRQYDFFARPDQMLVVPTQRLASSEKFLPRNQGGFITLSGWMGNRLDESTKALTQLTVPASVSASFIEATPSAAAASLEGLQGLASEFTGLGAKAFKHFTRLGSYSYQNALTRDMRMLGEWKPVDGFKMGSEASMRYGFDLVSCYLKELFTAQGDIDTSEYQAYARKVQGQLSSRMAGLFSTGAEKAGWQGDERLLAAVAAVKGAQETLFAKLQAAAAPQDSEMLAKTLDSLRGDLNSAMNDAIQGASQRVIEELATVSVTTASGSAADARPAIRGELSHALALGLAPLVARTSAPLATRLAALAALQAQGDNAAKYALNYSVETTDASGKIVKAVASEVRKQAIVLLVAALGSQKAPLDALVAKNRYLTAAERETIEFLATALTALSPPKDVPEVR